MASHGFVVVPSWRRRNRELGCQARSRLRARDIASRTYHIPLVARWPTTLECALDYLSSSSSSAAASSSHSQIRGFTVRLARPDEFYDVAHVRVLSFYDRPSDRVYDPIRRKEIYTTVQTRATVPGMFCLVAVKPSLEPSPMDEWIADPESDVVVGTADVALYDMKGCHVSPPVDEGQHLLYVSSMAVLPDFRRRGIARKLLRYAIELGNNLGVPDVFLHVSAEDNPAAVELYRSMKFRINDRPVPTWIQSHAKEEHTLLRYALPRVAYEREE